MPDTRPGKPPATISRLGFLRRLAMVAGALGLGLRPWPGWPRPGADAPGPAPRPSATPALTPPSHSVKRRG